VSKSLEAFGWTSFFASQVGDIAEQTLVPLRVVEDFGRIYRILGEAGEIWAETSGRLRHRAAGSSELPAVGDWVLASLPAGDGRAVIQKVLRRSTHVARKAAGERLSEQVVAANVDFVFVMQSLDRDFNLRRIERYLVVVRDGGATPVVLLTKSDLAADAIASCIERVGSVAPGVAVRAVSARVEGGLDPIRHYLAAGRTIALLGSSGVGKSTLANALCGADIARVAEVRESDGKGRHTTTGRRLLVLPGGVMLVDTPGMRELALWDGEGALDDTFGELADLAAGCRFRDCRHEEEPDCAVLDAAAQDPALAARLESWKKLHAELAHVAREQDLAQRLAEKGRARQGSKDLKRFYKDRG
jgi:ribosome biogenesis GTPase